jgi:hypothetical protein
VTREKKMSETACKQLVASFFNEMLFGATHSILKTNETNITASNSHTWKNIDIKQELLRKFPSILFEDEAKEGLEQWIQKESVCFKLVISVCLNLQVELLCPSLI